MCSVLNRFRCAVTAVMRVMDGFTRPHHRLRRPPPQVSTAYRFAERSMMQSRASH